MEPLSWNDYSPGPAKNLGNKETRAIRILMTSLRLIDAVYFTKGLLEIIHLYARIINTIKGYFFKQNNPLLQLMS